MVRGLIRRIIEGRLRIAVDEFFEWQFSHNPLRYKDYGEQKKKLMELILEKLVGGKK